VKLSILVTPAGMLIEVSELAKAKEKAPIEVSELGIVIDEMALE
jgi:hypothetical protein